MESHSEYRKRIMRISVRQYFHYVFYNPRLVCRIMASLNVVFFMTIGMILLWNIWWEEYYRLQVSSISKPSNLNITFDWDSKIPIQVIYEKGDTVITKSMINLCFTTMMVIVNVQLKMATHDRSLNSISIWLFVHTTHMLYSLSINLWVGVAKGYNSLICLALFNTFLYFLFISLVGLFWMEERCSKHCIMRIPMSANDKAATKEIPDLRFKL